MFQNLSISICGSISDKALLQGTHTATAGQGAQEDATSIRIGWIQTEIFKDHTVGTGSNE